MIEKLKAIAAKRMQGNWFDKVFAEHNFCKCADEMLAVVEQAEKVSEFLEGRWSEDHAYRDRFLNPLHESVKALHTKIKTEIAGE